MNQVANQLEKKWSNADWTETRALDQSHHFSDENLIAVGGCARSGTTVVRMILDSHSQLVMGPPTNVFIPTPLSPEDIAFRLALNEELIAELARSQPDRVRFIEGLAQMTKTHYRKSRWGDKTARNVYRFDWILQHFPQSRVIHVIRDGRDVVCSLRTHRRRQVVNGALVPANNRMPLHLCIDRWVESVQIGILSRNNRRYHELRYEELIAGSASTVKGLCDFLEVEFEPPMLKFHEFRGPLRDPIKFPQNLEATLPLYSAAVGRWRQDLTKQEREVVEGRLASSLTKLGYIQ